MKCNIEAQQSRLFKQIKNLFKRIQNVFPGFLTKPIKVSSTLKHPPRADRR